MSNNQIVLSSEAGLATALSSLEASIYAAAARNLEAAIAASPVPVELTVLERTSVLEVEALKLTNSIDYAALRIRGRIIHRLREQNLATVHPEHYARVEDAARDVGISSTEVSYIEQLCGTIFPWMEANGMNVSEVWHDVGKAKFFDMAPILAAVISGTLPGRGSTREAVLDILNEQSFDAEAPVVDGNTISISDAVRNNAVNRLIEIGSTLPSREARRTLRPSATPDITTILIRQGEMYYGLMEMDEDQKNMFMRLNNQHINESVVDARPELEPQIGMIRTMLGA
jgi:hypothetical protein